MDIPGSTEAAKLECSKGAIPKGCTSATAHRSRMPSKRLKLIEEERLNSATRHANFNTTGAEQQSNREHTRGSSDENQQSNAKKHSHRKKSTWHDNVPHDDISLLNTSEVLKISAKNLETSQRKFGNDRKFRDTRTHIDKKKELKNEEEKCILDTSIPILKEKPIGFTITSNSTYTALIKAQKSNNQDELKPPFTQINKSNKTSNSNKLDPLMETEEGFNRDELKPSFTEISKSNENQHGNKTIADLINLSSNSSKLDPLMETVKGYNSNELKPSFTEIRKRNENHHGNKNIAHLLNLSSNSSKLDPLIETEGYNRDELKPSFTEISKSNENQHGNNDIADLINLSSNSSKLNPLMETVKGYNSNELKPSFTEIRKRNENHHGNKNIAHLLNLSSNSSKLDPLIETEGYNRDELKPSFTEISKSNENQHGNNDIADLINLSSNSSKLDPLMETVKGYNPNELKPSFTEISISNENHHGNKNIAHLLNLSSNSSKLDPLIETEGYNRDELKPSFTEISISNENHHGNKNIAHLLNLSSNSSKLDPLIETEGYNRDELKPSFTEISKSNENQHGNNDIADLINLSSNSSKLDPLMETVKGYNSNELKPSLTEISISNENHHGNKNIAHLLNLSSNSSKLDPLIETEGYNRDELKPSFTEICKSNENHHGNKNIADLINLSSNSSKLDPLIETEGYNRDELKPSFTEISKSNENHHGNKNFADLINWSSNSSKLDPNTSTFSQISQENETAPSDNVNSIINESRNYSVFTYRSNKSPIVQMQHLKRQDDRMSSEISHPPQNTYKIKLPQTQELRVFKGECALKTQFIQNLVLAHSKIRLDMIEKPTDATFFKEIFDEMSNLNITKLFRLQSYSWPHLLRGNSLFIVNPPKSGKTWSYLPAICNLVTYYVQNYTSTNMYGPIGIVLVPSSSHVEKINHYCKSLLFRFKTPVTTVASFGVRNVNEVKISLLDSCGLLIATPASFLRILEENDKEPLIDFKRLRHLVIDDMDLILTRSKIEFEVVMKVLFKMCRHVNPRNEQVLIFQMVVTSRVWDSTMLAMLRKSNQPLLLIGDFLEAAVYGKATLSMKLCANDKKIATIMQFIEENSLESKRLLILCNSDDDVSKVMTGLKASNYMCIGYNSDTSVEELVFADEWKNEKVASSRILVCTDAIFSQIQIQNVRYLIHYSMSTTWTKFTTRFSALAQTYENHVANNFKATRNTTEENSLALILLDEENSLQLPFLLDFMKKHSQLKFIHKDILAVSKQVSLANEEVRIKKGVDLCPLFLEFGECDMRCPYRHNLSSFDVFSKTDEIPSNGDIRILILKVFSPTHYSARLLQHRRTGSNEWQDIRQSNEVCKFGMQLNLHYSNQDNLIIHWPLHIGDLCVYKESGNFQRATILEVPEILSIDIIKTVQLTVKLIDQGLIKPKVKSDMLFVCHEKFKQFPVQAVDIRLLGIVPFDNEQTWESSATKSVRNWLINSIKKTKFIIHANIDFALANTIWVKNVIVMEHLPTLGKYIYRINVKRSIVEKNIGAIARTKNSKIRNMAEECGLLINNKEDIEPEKELVSSCVRSSIIEFSSNETMQSDNFISSTNKVNETKPPSIGAKIEKTNHEEQDWDKSLMNDTNRNKEIFVPIPKVMEEKDILDDSSVDKIASHYIKEEWLKLPLLKIVKVEIGDVEENGNWKDIFLQCVDNEQMSKFIQLLELTEEHISKLNDTQLRPFPASWFRPMQNCIVHYDNRYLRAKLDGIFDCVNKSSSVYRFFLCDYACFVIVKGNQLFDNFLYPTTKQIIEFMPYQAIHCTLTGIHLTECAEKYKVKTDYLFAYAVSENDNVSINTSNFNINSFEIILFENKTETDLSTMEMVNTALVQNDAAKLNNNTKHYLDLEIGIVKNEIQNGNDLCNFAEFIDCFERAIQLEAEEHQSPTGQEHEKMRESFEESKALCSTLKKQIQTTDYTNIALNDSSTTKENIEIVPEKKNHTNRSAHINDGQPLCSTSSSQREQLLNLPPLKLLRKHPKATWYDTDYLIYLTIHAPDITDYYLEVSTNTLLFAAKAQEEEYVLVLNFLFFVEPQLVAHEIRGLNVTVRLVKSVYIKWPRLLKQTTKYRWLQYNLNAINIEQMDSILPQQQIESILMRNQQFILNSNGSDSDDSDGEKNLFETFPPIVNSEDVHDPTSEMI